MNCRSLALLIVVAACLAAAPRESAAAENYGVDASHTSVVFSISHAKLSYTYGMFRQAAGSYVLDRENPANSRFRFVIQVNSIDTNHAGRDEHLKGPDFFNVQQFPTIAFESTTVAAGTTPEGAVVYQVTGNLSMHGVTQQVTVPLQMLGEGAGARGDQRTGFLTQFTLNRSDYGMNNLLHLVGDAVGVTISFEGVQQAAAAPAGQGRP